MAKKTDVIAAVADEFDMTKKDAESVAGYVLDAVYDMALEDGACAFGNHKFIKKTTAARKGRNPQTGESLDIPAKTKVVYKRLNR